ncbi:MAG: site-2 protease family protein [Shimia sp.]
MAELTPLPVAHELREGDEILAIEGRPITRMEDLGTIRDAIPLEPLLDYRVRRDGDEITVPGPYPSPTLAVGVSLESAALAAGLRPGDVVTEIDGQPVFAFRQLVEAVTGAEGAPLTLSVWRDGETRTEILTPRRTDERLPEGGFRTEWRIGLQGGTFFAPATEALAPLAAIGQAAGQVWLIIVSSLDGLWNIVTGAISTCNLSGPIGIAETSGAMAAQGAQSFVWFVAVLSTAVGLLNLFPIPILDGGHLVFHAYEAVTGRRPSDRALQYLMAFGLALIGTLMVFAIGSDLFC